MKESWELVENGVRVAGGKDPRYYDEWMGWFDQHRAEDDNMTWTHVLVQREVGSPGGGDGLFLFDTYILIKNPQTRMMFKLVWCGR